MITKRKFNIVEVVSKKGIGMDTATNFDKVVDYMGKKVVVKL
jgi:hypothetical protein